MGWFEKTFFRKARSAAERDLREGLDFLRSMTDEDLGLTCATVHYWRGKLKALGYDVMNPSKLVQENPFASLEIAKLVEHTQKQNLVVLAAGLKLWVLTIRSAYDLNKDQRPMVIQLWRELSRGFYFAQDGVALLEQLFNIQVDLIGLREFPLGYDPLIDGRD